MTVKKPESVKLVQAPEENVPAEIIASSIVKIANAAESMTKAGLNRRAIIILLAASSGLNRTIVGQVLNAMLTLKATYLVSAKAKRP